MKLGKLLSIGEIAEQPPVEDPPAASPELTRRETAAATADGDHAEVPALAQAGR